MGFYFLFWKHGPNQISNLCTLPYSLKPCLNIYWRITLVLKKHEFKCCFENRFKLWKDIKLCFDSLSTAVMEGGAALGYMVAICHGYSHQTDQPCPALNIQYFHFLSHLFFDAFHYTAIEGFIPTGVSGSIWSIYQLKACPSCVFSIN